MKKEISIPTDLSEIKLWQYQQFLRIEEPDELDLISSMLRMKKETVSKFKLSNIEEISGEFEKMFSKEQDFKPTFKIGSRKFGFIPNLDDIAFGENNDLVRYIQDWDTMHNAMAVMFRPITQEYKGKYKIEEYEGSAKYADQMKDAPLDVCMGAMVFFYRLTGELLNSTLKFMEAEAATEMKKGSLSEKNGQSIINSLNSLKETLGDLTKFQSSLYTSAFTTSAI